MRFGKIRMFLLLNGLVGLGLACYFAPWLFSKVTLARTMAPFESNLIHLQYTVAGKTYLADHLRNGISSLQNTVPVRYLTFHPQTSRVNSFMGMWAEPLAWWSVFLLASSMLLLTHNTVFSKGTIFQVHRKFPWISMDEYFPYTEERYQWRQASAKANSERSPSMPKQIKY
ncbi:MAG: hypothetical protein ACXVMS_09435 [Flavisolibacter sp.]